MDKVLKSGAAEIAPKDMPGECWYLPLFGVHNGNVVLRPSLRTWVLRTLILVGACTLPRHTSPIITHPSGSFWAKGFPLSLGIQGKHAQFNMSSCSGNSTLTGRLANNICVQSIDGESTFELQDVIECNSIPLLSFEVLTKCHLWDRLS
jgi:hypothetical protein